VKQFIIFTIIVSIYLVAGLLYATQTPLWQAPDEPAHYNYVRYLATHQQFPAQQLGCYNQAYLSTIISQKFPPNLSINDLCYEYHQPPLYYMLAGAVYWFSNGSPIAIRFLSVLFGVGTVIIAGFTARLIFPKNRAVGYGTMAFVAFVPMHSFMLASINNDSLAGLLFAWLLYLLIRLLCQATITVSEASLVGLVLGLALLTKLTIYIAVPLVALALIKLPLNWKEMIKLGLLIYGIAFMLVLPWYLRNINLYGWPDILGLQRHDEIVVGQLRTSDYVAEVGWQAYSNNFLFTTFHSFWGQFGWMAVPMDNRVYTMLWLITGIALGGLLGFSYRRGWRTLPPPQHSAFMVMAWPIIFILLAYGWYNWQFVQFQGRYLFPAIIPLGLFFSMGLSEAFQPRWQWWLIGGLGLALIGVGFITLQQGYVDKWQILLTTLPLALAIVRIGLQRYIPIPTEWVMIIIYGGLAGLSVVAPFWFIQPYL